MTFEEISQAHPKCAHLDGTPWCEHFTVYPVKAPYNDVHGQFNFDCTNPESAYNALTTTTHHNPKLDYCRLHSELMKGK